MSHDISKQDWLRGILAAISVVLLMGGTVFGAIPVASAQEDDDEHDDHEDKDKKCKKKRYGDICDRVKPLVEILGLVKANHKIKVTGVAVDNPGGSGIKKVEVQLDHSPYVVVSTGPGGWEFVQDGLSNGNHKVTVKATDNAGNVSRDHVTFKIR